MVTRKKIQSLCGIDKADIIFTNNQYNSRCTSKPQKIKKYDIWTSPIIIE